MFKRSKPDSPVEERNVRLMHHLHITEDIVNTNRTGNFTDGQRRKLESYAKQNHSVYMIIPLIFLAIGIIGIGYQLYNDGTLTNLSEDQLPILVIGLGGSLLLYIVLLIYAFWRAKRQSNIPIDDMEIQHFTGNVKVTNTDSYPLILKIKRKRIVIMNKNAENAFVNGTPYTIYYINQTGMGYFLSAEASD